jgi:MFS family permease
MSKEIQGASGHQIHNYQLRRNVKKSLRLSILDGGAYAAMMGLTQNYITPFALALKATTAQIGLISSIPNLMMAFAQLASPALAVRAGSRKGLILPASFIHALTWLPLFLLPYFYRSPGVWWLLAFYTVNLASDAMTQPAWGSMMADLVHEDVRGRYFSSRGRIAQFIVLVFSLAAGAILQVYTGHVFAGFGILFGGAMVFRLLSFFFLSRMYEPPFTPDKANAPGVQQLVRNLGASNLGKFTLYISLIYFGMMISGPFFSVFMLRDLHFSYVTYTIVSAASTLAVLVFLPFWGRRADRAGNLKIIRITSFLMPAVPLLWVLNGNPIYLVATNVVSGFTWSGFNLASVNFVYDASEPASRTKQIAVFNSITCVALCLGALLGGYLIPHLPKTLGFQIRTLFIISGVFRAFIALLLLRTVVEVRRVTQIDTFQLILGRSASGEKENNHGKSSKEVK